MHKHTHRHTHIPSTNTYLCLDMKTKETSCLFSGFLTCVSLFSLKSFNLLTATSAGRKLLLNQRTETFYDPNAHLTSNRWCQHHLTQGCFLSGTSTERNWETHNSFSKPGPSSLLKLKSWIQWHLNKEIQEVEFKEAGLTGKWGSVTWPLILTLRCISLCSCFLVPSLYGGIPSLELQKDRKHLLLFKCKTQINAAFNPLHHSQALLSLSLQQLLVLMFRWHLYIP